MMPFSIETGLERVGVVGPELGLLLGRPDGSGRWTPLQKQERRRVSEGFRPWSLRCLVSSSLRENIGCLEGECFCVPFTDGVAWYL